MTRRFSGLIAAVHTPMAEDGSLALDRAGCLIEHLERDGIGTIFVAGTTGEGLSLTTRERREVAESFIRAARGRLPVIVHVGHNSLREAGDLAAHARDAGAAAIAAVTPSYFKPATAEDLAGCLGEIAGRAPELPLLYYHIPSHTGVRVDLTELLDAAPERVPTLSGIKYTDPGLPELLACLQHGEGRFEILFGMDEMLLAALSMGVQGAVGGTYNFAAPLYLRLIEAFGRGDLEEARRLQAKSAAMIRIVLRHGGLAGLKGTMKLVGVDCGPPRRPLVRLAPGELEVLRSELAAIGFFEWARPQSP